MFKPMHPERASEDMASNFTTHAMLSPAKFARRTLLPLYTILSVSTNKLLNVCYFEFSTSPQYCAKLNPVYTVTLLPVLGEP